MGDFLFGFIIGRVAIGLFRLYFKLLWFLARTAWWLLLFLLFSLAAGIKMLARGGRRTEEDSGHLGHYLPDDAGYQEDESGTVYPLSVAGQESCTVVARDVGMNWQATALSRLLRRGAIVRYRFEAVPDPGSPGRREIAGWCEFLQEARHNITLDHLDPAQAATDPYGLEDNRKNATVSLDYLTSLLERRGWELVGMSGDMSNQHWYALRFSRRAVDWDAAVAVAAARQQPAAISAEQPDGRQ